jgi:membrane fusion protein (multidrug efflux system)
VRFSSVLTLLAAAIAATLSGCSNSETNSAAPAGAPAPPVPQVGFVTLHAQQVPFIATVPGRTVASGVSEIRPQVSGIIQKRLFEEGAEVKSGDVLYQIDDRPYRAALDSAKAAAERAKATVANAQAEFDRQGELARRNVASQQQLDAARAALAQAQADLAGANAAIETAQINLDNTRLTAPISGLIGTSLVTEGALVTANQAGALVTVRQMDPMFVDMTASSANLLRVRTMIAEGTLHQASPSPEVRLTLEDGSQYPEVGSIQATEANVSETTGTVTIRARIANPKHVLLPGMYVSATVAVGTGDKGFLLPQRAVSRNAKGQATAMFVSADGKAEQRILQTQQSYQDAWLVYENVSEGDRLIVDGLQKLRSGQAVKPTEVRLDAQGVAQDATSSTTPGE